MFKRFKHFAGDENHPGQPVHCDQHFDVWLGKDGQHFTVLDNGERITGASVAEVKKAAEQKMGATTPPVTAMVAPAEPIPAE